MKHRAISAVLFGFGVLLLVFAAGLAFVVTPAISKLPYDLERSVSVAEAPRARFLQIKEEGQLEINTADLRSTVAVQPNAKATADLTGKLDDTAVVWTVGQTVERTDTKELISAYGAELALDRVSGEGVGWDGQWLDETGERSSISFQGQVYKFPFNTEKKDYQIFDRDLRKALPAHYQGTEEIEGIETYRFEQVISGQEINLDESRVNLLLAKFAPEATTGKLVYSNTRTVWVDPVTGSYLKVREVQRKVLQPISGASTVLLDAAFESTEENVKASAGRARTSRLQLGAVGVFIPTSFGIFGLLAIIGSLLLARRGAVAAMPPRHRADDGAVDAGSSGPLTDELPAASGNWRSDDPTVPDQRQAPGGVERL